VFDVLPQLPAGRGRRPWLPVASVAAALAVVAAVILLVVGAPFGGSSSAEAATIVRAASGRAAAVGSSDVQLQMTMKMAGMTVTATGTGSFDYRHRVGQMQLNGLGQMQEIVTPTAIYMRMPDRVSGMAALGGRPWLMLRFADFKARGVDLGKLMNQGGNEDPSSMLRVLSRASAVHRGGSATIDGVRTTHYTATAGFLDLVRAQGLDDSIDLSQLPPGMASTALHIDIWIDKHGLPRRMGMDMSGGAFAGASVHMLMTFLNFGTPVTVVPPPADIVTDMGALLRANGG
jgi:hypothetical protein